MPEVLRIAEDTNEGEKVSVYGDTICCEGISSLSEARRNMSRRLEKDNTRERGCETNTVKYETVSMFALTLNDLTYCQNPSSLF